MKFSKPRILGRSGNAFVVGEVWENPTQTPHFCMTTSLQVFVLEGDLGVRKMVLNGEI